MLEGEDEGSDIASCLSMELKANSYQIAANITAVFCLVFTSLTATAELKSCRAVIEPKVEWSNSPSEMDAIRASWAPRFFSNPQMHDPKNFRYIVTIIHWKLPVESSLERAQTISEISSMSASVISNDHLMTFGSEVKSGYILSVPERNVLNSNPQDYAWADINDPRGASLVQPELFGLNTPESLLQESKRIQRYNEVRIAGQVGGSKIKVSAIFYAKMVGNRRITPSEMSFLEELAQRLKVPLLELPLN